MNYPELLKAVNSRKHFILMISSGCEHCKYTVSDTFQDTISAIKEKSSQEDNFKLSFDEFKTLIDNHLANSEKLEEITNQSIMMGIKKFLGNNRETEEFVFELLKKHKKIDINEEHPFLNQDNALTAFFIDDYLMTYQKHFDNIKSTHEYLNHITKLLVLNKDKLGMEDLTVFQRQENGRDYHQYYITSVNNVPVNTEVIYNIFDKSLDMIKEKLDNKASTDMSAEIEDIILFCKLEKNLPMHETKETGMKI
jgi:predicted nucleic acid-binding protein